MLTALGRLDAEGGVASGAAASFNVVPALVGLGPGEEGLVQAEESVDQRLRNAVVGDDDETVVLVGGAEIPHEALVIDVPQAQGRDLLCHVRILHAHGAYVKIS